MIEYRLAEEKDIPAIMALHKKFHISTIADEDREGGFITATFSSDDLLALIGKMGCISLAFDGERLVGFVFSAAWEYWNKLELFAYMAEHLPESAVGGVTITDDNSYHYGPVCVDTDYRGKGILPKMFDVSKTEMRKKYDLAVTFVNVVNDRSCHVHKNKLDFDVTKTFAFNDNEYYEMVFKVG